MMQPHPRPLGAGPKDPRPSSPYLSLAGGERQVGEGESLGSKRRPVNGTGVAALRQPFRSNTGLESKTGPLQDPPNPHSSGRNSVVPTECVHGVLAISHDDIVRSSDDAMDRYREERSASSPRWRVLNKEPRPRVADRSRTYQGLMKNLGVGMSLSLVLSGLTGCASWPPWFEPKKITVEDAMKDVAEGLNRMYDLRKDYPRTGLLPEEVTVIFNVSASGTDQRKLYLEAGATVAETLKVAKAGGEVGSTLALTRGNTITVKFRNLLFAPKDLLVSTMKPGDLKQLIDALHQVGFETLFTTKEGKSKTDSDAEKK